MQSIRLRLLIGVIVVGVLGIGATAWAAGPNVKTYTGCLTTATGAISKVQQGNSPIGTTCPSGSTKISISGGDITEVLTAPGSGLTGGDVNGSVSLSLDFALLDSMYVNEEDASKLNWRGTWGAATAYVPNDVVLSQGSSYVAKIANTNTTPATNPAAWQQVAQKGAKGAAGATGAAGSAGPQGRAGLVWRGTWSASTSYAVGDAVAQSGNSYVALIANSNKTPASNPTNWQLLAKKGAAGPQGAPGFNWRGEWDPGVTYISGDVVSFDGSTYHANGESLPGVAPPDDDPAYWSVVAAGGTDGHGQRMLSAYLQYDAGTDDCTLFSEVTVTVTPTGDGACSLHFPPGTFDGYANAYAEWATIEDFLAYPNGQTEMILRSAREDGYMLVTVVSEGHTAPPAPGAPASAGQPRAIGTP